jgi:hypothetical protein
MAGPRELFDRPVLIVSSPRSGSTLLFETLAQAPNLFTIGSESHQIIERIPGLGPATRGWDSNRLTAQDLQPQIGDRLARSFYEMLRDRYGSRPAARARMLEKTPKNSLRVPFFHALWPDAIFVYLYREPRQTMASMIRGWQSGRFRTYRLLPGWGDPPWSFLLVPGWEPLRGRPISEIVARQWATTTETLVSDLAALPSNQVRIIDYDEFVASPQAQIKALARSLDLDWDRQLPVAGLPLSRYTLSAPERDKWRSLEAEIEAVLPLIQQAEASARAFVSERRKS